MMNRRLSIISLLTILSIALGLLTPGSGWNAVHAVHAATIIVTNNNDSGAGSLRAAITSAGSGDTITFAANVTGAITLTSGVLTISQNLTITGPGAATLAIDGNHASRVFLINSGTVNLSGLTIRNGNTGNNFDGGGIYNNATLTVSNSTFSGNSATIGGGGIFNNSGATLTVSNSTTFFNNSAPNGGGIYNTSSGATLTVSNSTFSGNSASNGVGGGIYNAGGTTNLGSTIVAGNTTTSTGPDINGAVSSQGHNLIGNSSGGSGFVASDQLNVNPLLNSLANYGGPTQTMSLQSGSPAISKGNCNLIPLVTTDQRGIARKTPCDVGAYETPAPYVDTIGLYTQSAAQFYLRNSNSAGNADFIFLFGPSSNAWRPLAGDWTGQGKTTIGLYDPSTGTFYLRNSNSNGNADLAFQYGPGNAGMFPLVGDWTGQDKKTVGLYSPASGYFYLHNCNTATCSSSDIVFAYGPPNAGLTPIVGDWTNKGYDSVGLYSQAGAFFYLHNCNAATCGSGDTVFQYGPATSNGGAPAAPLIGHWVSGNPATIGVYVPANAYWYLKNTNAAGNADTQFQYGPGPNAGWLAVIGHWGTPGTIETPPEAIPVAPRRISGSVG